MRNPVLELAVEVATATERDVDQIETVVKQAHLLSINARVEAARAGTVGRAFGVVAGELGELAAQISRIAGHLRDGVTANTKRLEVIGTDLDQTFRATRYTDLALAAIDIIDRNLYERSCDVRWWATDSAVVDAVMSADADVRSHASDRLSTILRSYTVYLDLWVADARGRVAAAGRPGTYRTHGLDVSASDWFTKAMRTQSGDDFVACDVGVNPVLNGAAVATYATAIRQGGAPDGRPLGALGIFFDWHPQAKTVLDRIALTEQERLRARALIVDSRGRIIARSGGLSGVSTERFTLRTEGRTRGHYVADGRLIAFALTPGYETYEGLGWYGVIEAEVDA